MTYTKHGHHIPGTIKGTDRPKDVIRCGGVVLCTQCIEEAAQTPPDIPAKSMHVEEQVEWDIDANQPAKSFPAEIMEQESELEKGLGRLLNYHSAENESGTPDFILAMFLKSQLDLFNQTIKNRAVWRGESVELPALQRLGKEDPVYVDLDTGQEIPSKVPLVTYQDGRRNELGTATVTITPGEALVEGKVVTAVEAIFEDVDVTESKESAPPASRFERYQKGLSNDQHS